jgi:hypothetical protein
MNQAVDESDVQEDVETQSQINKVYQGRPDVVNINDINITKSKCPLTNTEILEAVDPSMLNNEQRRAYDVVMWHLDQTLSGKNPPPLRMIIHGEGGTGKSKILQTITKAFKDRQCQCMLVKAAYTGVAASLIEGKTTHIIGGMSGKSGRFSTDDSITDETRSKLGRFWEHRHYLAVDEMSMIAKDFFALLARNISIGKGNSNGQSFGGVNVIILGDFHQFPPVARSNRDALYYPIDFEKDSLSSQIGRATYEEFTTVVVLREQKRISDPIWHDFLQHLRVGTVNKEHVKMLRSLILSKKDEPSLDFSSDPWREAPLITPRHAVRCQWNDAGLRKMCRENGRQILVCIADDSIKGRPITIKERCILEAH